MSFLKKEKIYIRPQLGSTIIYSPRLVRKFNFQKPISFILVLLLILEIVVGVFLLTTPQTQEVEAQQLGQNWVRDFLAQNPEYANMEIVGRTEKSITFKRSDGQLVTQIVDFPIHYLDENSQWQPIDTKLVYYPDSDEYGAGGLYTRIRPDGTVRIIGENGQTIHTQRTTGFGKFNADTKEFTSLGTFTNGSALGDTLTRSVGDIEHKLKITDLGLKEELILPNALTGISPNDLVAMKTRLGNEQLFPDGWVEDNAKIANYHLPVPVSFDANTKLIPTKRYAQYIDGYQYVYTGILDSSLSGAVYPITIDPDYLDSTNDGYVIGESNTYALARSTSVSYVSNLGSLTVGQPLDGETGIYDVMRGFLKFDTSAIPDGDTITQVNLKLVSGTDNSDTDFDVQIVKQNWSAQDPLSDANREAAYDNCLAGTADDNIWRNTAGMSVDTQYASGNLSTSWVSKTGSTYYCLRSSRDYSNTSPGSFEHIAIYSQEFTTVAYRPILTVVHAGSNTAPDAPTSLAQYKSDCSTSISTGGWTNETGVCLKGYINDADTNDNVKLQVDYATNTLDNIVNATSTVWCADPCTASTTISGLSNGSQYKWQGRSVDDDFATSTWAQFNSGNIAFGVDTSVPDIVAVDAGASSTDRISLTSNTWFKYSDTGSDDQISFSWTDSNSASNDTFYYELNASSSNTIDGTEASTTNPYIDSITVSEGTNYFHVKPKNGAATWGTERTFAVKYDKTAPTNVGISSITPSSTSTLSILANTATDAGSGLHSTPYYFSQNPGSPNSGWQASTTWIDSGLSANTQYTYIVRAKDALNNESASSTASSKYTLANQVSSLSAANATDKSNYKIDLTWTNQGQTGMKIEQDANCDGYETTLYNNTTTNTTSPYSVSVSANTCYKFRISSYNAEGVINNSSIPETSQITAPPAQPQNLTHTANTETSISWDWDDTVAATGYKVYRTIDDLLLTTINTATSSWAQDTLNSNTQYSVYIRATNANGEGISSLSASAYTSANIPVNPSHSTNTTSSIAWTWATGGAQKDYYAWTTTPSDNSGWTLSAFWQQLSLTANNLYQFFVKARNENLDETSSANSSSYASQNTPTGISFSTITTDSITLSAIGVFNNLTSGSAGLYFLNTTSSTTPGWLQTNSWINSSLSPNIQYTYQAKARNGNSDETSYCAATSTYTLANIPGTPTFSDVSTSTLKVIINQNSNPSNTEYAIYATSTNKYAQSGGALGDSPVWQTYTNWGGNSGSAIIGLNENTSYTFTIKARNGNNTETSFGSGISTTTAISAPTAPSGANLDNISTSSMRLNWTDNSNNEDEFRIEKSINGVDYSLIATTTANTTSTNINLLSLNTQYYFRVRAYNAGGNSSYSTADPKYILANIPETLTISNVSTSTLKVVVNINSNPTSTNYAIYENSTAKYVSSSTGALNQATESWQTFSGWGSASGFTIIGLSDNTLHTFKAKARNGDNVETAFSSTIATTTAISAPTAPSGANLDNISTSSMRLNWTDNASSEAGFKIEQSADGNIYTEIATTMANVTTYSITSLTCNTQYYFRVRAYNTGGNSNYSVANNITSVCPAYCGDGVCNGSETCGTCSSDCGACSSDCDSCRSGVAPLPNIALNIPEPKPQIVAPIITPKKEAVQKETIQEGVRKEKNQLFSSRRLFIKQPIQQLPNIIEQKPTRSPLPSPSKEGQQPTPIHSLSSPALSKTLNSEQPSFVKIELNRKISEIKEGIGIVVNEVVNTIVGTPKTIVKIIVSQTNSLIQKSREYVAGYIEKKLSQQPPVIIKEKLTESLPPPVVLRTTEPEQPSFVKIEFNRKISEIKEGIGITVSETANTIAETSKTTIKTMVFQAISLIQKSRERIKAYFVPTQLFNVKTKPISSTSVEITWETNHKATTKVNYGLTREYDREWQDGKKVKIHKVVLNNLLPDTTYHYEVMSQNSNYVYDADRIFKTEK